MAFELKPTPGDSDANSFVSAAEMTAYCEARLNASIWTAGTPQLPALAEATRDISFMNFKGERTTDTQALSWPRQYTENPDAPNQPPEIYYLVGSPITVYYADTIIPQRVKDAVCELALQYLKAGETDLAVADPTRGVIQKTVGPLTTVWESGGKRATGLARYPRVMQLLYPLLASSGSAGNIDMVRV